MVGDANKYLSDQAPWKIKDDPARLGHDPARGAAGGQRLQHAAHAVPAALRAEDPRAARRHRRARADAGDARGRRIWTVARATRSSPVTTPVGARWESVPLEVGRALAAAEAGLPQARSLHCGRGAGPPRRLVLAGDIAGRVGLGHVAPSRRLSSPRSHTSGRAASRLQAWTATRCPDRTGAAVPVLVPSTRRVDRRTGCDRRSASGCAPVRDVPTRGSRR